MTAAATLVRRWVRLYTRGLPAHLRDARRAEIECDLWSQTEEAELVGRAPNSVGIEMLARLVLGIPADIGWRQSHRGGSVPSAAKEIRMREPFSHRALTVLGAAWAVLGLVFSVAGLVQIQENRFRDPADAVWIASVEAVVMIAGVMVALVGLLLIGRNPMAGRTAALVGAAVAGVAFFVLLPWMFPIGIAMVVPLALVAVVRARQVLDAGRRQSA
jgi:peptidoglycan/LPS O-acetylase OafA/YrhL